ncbi:MAG: CotH kinase family protein [Candidatus Marinimicrobia bacterium]|nr:CotH kinase family protein [Candidatus Neomarinimicrobiota bacterium]
MRRLSQLQGRLAGLLGLGLVFWLAAGPAQRLALERGFRMANDGAGRLPARPRNAGARVALRQSRGLPFRAPLEIAAVGQAGPDGPTTIFGEPADWIELRHIGRRPLSLRGYSLTDNPRRNRRWQLPAITLTPGERLVIWAVGQSGVYSRYSAKGLPARHRRGWTQAPDDHLIAGFAWQAEGPGTTNLPPARIRFEVPAPPAPTAQLWLNTRYPEARRAAYRVTVNGRPAHLSAPERPDPGYQSLLLRNPEHAEGAWTATSAHWQVEIHLAKGELLIDQVVASPMPVLWGRHAAELRAAFRLSATGETLALHGPAGLPLDAVHIPTLAPGASYRRRGKDFQIEPAAPGGQPLPGLPTLKTMAANEDGRLTVAVTPGAQTTEVRYTLDGAWPTVASPVCPAELTLASPAVLRVRGFHPDGFPGPTTTALYPASPPAAGLPVLDLIMAPGDLTNSARGILAYPEARGRHSERPAALRLTMPDGSQARTLCGVRIQGRSSRIQDVKRAYRLLFRAAYGAAELPAGLFPPREAPGAQGLVLQSQSMVGHPLGLEIMAACGVPTPRGRHVLLRINGVSEGLFVAIEDPNRTSYLADLFGHADLEVIKHKASRAFRLGDGEAYRRDWLSLADQASAAPAAAWEQLSGMIAPDDFLRWVLGIQFLGVADNDQGYFVQDRQAAEHPWQLVAWDLDGALNRRLVQRRVPLLGLRGSIHQALLSAPAYRARYVALGRALLAGPLQPAPWLARLDEYERLLTPWLAEDHAAHQRHDSILARDRTPADYQAVYRQIFADTRAYLRERPAWLAAELDALAAGSQ